MDTESQESRSLSNSWYAKAATFVGAGSVIGASVPNAEAAVVSWPASGLTTTLSQNFLYFDFDTGNSALSGSTVFGGYDFVLTRNAVAPNVFGQLRFASGVSAAGLGTFTAGYAYPSRLANGAPIGPAGSFFVSGSGNFMTLAASPEATYPRGKWDGAAIGTPGFVGLRIGTPGNYRYGWVEVTVGADMHLTLGRFAIETTPNTAINAGAVPEVNSLALLAFGGTGLALHRRRRKEQAA